MNGRSSLPLRLRLQAAFPLETFEISLGFNREAISPHILVLPELCSNLFGSRLASLKTMVLTVNLESMKSSDSRARDLINFITLFPELESLSLSFEPRDGQLFRTCSIYTRTADNLRAPEFTQRRQRTAFTLAA